MQRDKQTGNRAVTQDTTILYGYSLVYVGCFFLNVGYQQYC